MFSKTLILLIKAYQYCCSPLLGERCRFFPSCSQYALECLHTHKLASALIKSTWRIMRCHPLSRGGLDLP